MVELMHFRCSFCTQFIMSANLLFEHICIDQTNFACNLIISCENSRIGNNFVLLRIQMKFASVKLLNMNENRIERIKYT